MTLRICGRCGKLTDETTTSCDGRHKHGESLLAALKAENEELHQHLERLLDDNPSWQEQCERLQDELEGRVKRITDQRKTLNKLQAKYNVVKGDLRTSNERVAELEGQIKAVREIECLFLINLRNPSGKNCKYISRALTTDDPPKPEVLIATEMPELAIEELREIQALAAKCDPPKPSVEEGKDADDR